MNGGGGTRTPKCLRTPHFECGALPVRTTPPRCRGAENRGARIRTGDLCDPNAALYRTEPRPVCEVPPSRFAQRTGWDGPAGTDRLRGLAPPGATPLRLERSNPTPLRLASLNGRGGIRTHAGKMPTRFPVVRLKPLGHPSFLARAEGVGWAGFADRLRGLAPFRRDSPSARKIESLSRRFASLKRREWDSNPRGPMDQRLSRAPLLAAQPSLRSSPAWARTRTLLIQSQTCCQLHHGAVQLLSEPPVGLEPTTPSLRVTCSTS